MPVALSNRHFKNNFNAIYCSFFFASLLSTFASELPFIQQDDLPPAFLSEHEELLPTVLVSFDELSSVLTVVALLLVAGVVWADCAKVDVALNNPQANAITRIFFISIFNL